MANKKRVFCAFGGIFCRICGVSMKSRVFWWTRYGSDVGEMWGKKIEKTLVESTLRGFSVPGATVEIINLTKIILN